MALNFPTSPTLGDIHQEGSYFYEYDGKKWQPIRRSYIVRKENVTPDVDNDAILDLSNANFFDIDVSTTTVINFENVTSGDTNSRFFVKINTTGDYSDTNITSYDINNLVYDNIQTEDLSTYGVYSFKFGGPVTGGEYLYVLENQIEYVRRYELGNPFDLTSIGTSTVSTSLAGTLNLTDLSDFCISNDGLKLYVTGGTNTTAINEFDLSSPWDITNPTFSTYLTFASSAFYSFTFSTNGDYLYIYEVGQTSADAIWQYELNSNFDFSGGSTLVGTFKIIGNNPTTSISKIRFSEDGRYMFISDRNTNEFRQYELSEQWQVSTASLVRLNSNENNILSNNMYSFEFNSDGSKMYYLNNLQQVSQYSSSNVTVDSVCDVIWPENVKWEYDTTPDTPDLNNSALYEMQTPDNGITYYARQIINNI